MWVDFEDIGGVYDDPTPSVAGANTSALNAFFSSESRPAIAFGGKKNSSYQNKRMPARAYFSGTITIPDTKPALIHGGNSRLSWITITGATPAISVGSGASGARRMLHSFDLDSSGSGILLDEPGFNTILSNIRMVHPDYDGAPIGSNACTGAGTGVSQTDFTDLDTASYGLKIIDGDSCLVDGIAILGPSDYGILVKGRLQAGTLRGRVWGSKNASGFKGENINGCQISLLNESNYSYGVWTERCGMGNWNGTTTHISTDRPNAWDIWAEANKGQGNPQTAHRVRQNRFRKCGGIIVGGNNGNASNKNDMDEGTRQRCKFVQSLWLPISVTPMYDLNQEDSGSPTLTLPDLTTNVLNNNWSTNWTTNYPTVTFTGTPPNTQLVISFPANSLQNITGGTAYWRPWGLLTNFTPAAGDTYVYSMTVRGDPAVAAWCLANDLVNSTILGAQIAPYAGPAGNVQLGLYNEQPRSVMGSVSLSAAGSVKATPGLTWDAGLPNNTSAMTLYITSLKFYGILEDGGKVVQS